jgi:hypothetical protein
MHNQLTGYCTFTYGTQVKREPGFDAKRQFGLNKGYRYREIHKEPAIFWDVGQN